MIALIDMNPRKQLGAELKMNKMSKLQWREYGLCTSRDAGGFLSQAVEYNRLAVQPCFLGRNSLL